MARSLLEADIANRAFSDQVGPALTQADVARLLGPSEQAVSKDGRLLRVHRFDGRPVYPVFQFDGRRQRPGGPVDALDDVDLDGVVAVAARFADRMAV